MRFRLVANAELETTTPEELRHELGRHGKAQLDALTQEALRGLKPFRLPTLIAAIPGVAQTAFSISDASTYQVSSATGTSSMVITAGPAQGMCWAVQRIGVDGMTTGDVFTIYRNSVQPNNKIDVVAMLSPTIYPGKLGMLLYPGDTFLANGKSALTAGQMTIYGEAIEVPMAMIGKLV